MLLTACDLGLRCFSRLSLGWLLLSSAFAADFSVSLADSQLVLTDLAGNGDVLTLSEPAPGFIAFTAPGRTFSVDGGPDFMATTDPISLTGLTKLTVNAGAGANTVNVGNFTTLLPTFAINGGTGDDTINFSGTLTLIPNASLDVDLQNDAPTPGTDAIKLAAAAKVTVTGSGNIVFKCSRDFSMDIGSSLEIVHGALLIEANQQPVPTPGTFAGISLVGTSMICSGLGNIDLIGRGGNADVFNPGISIQGGSLFRGGYAAVAGSEPLGRQTLARRVSGRVQLIGRGGASPGITAHGVFMEGTGTVATTLGGPILVTGTAGGTGVSASSHGVVLQNGATLSAGGTGDLTITGTGGSGNGVNNFGISLIGTGTTISTTSGQLILDGRGGSGPGNANYGINVQNGPTIRAGGAGHLTCIATAGSGQGRSQIGMIVTGFGSQVLTSGGNLTLNTQGGGSNFADSAHGLLIQSGGVVKVGGIGDVTVNATGGPGTGSTNIGLFMSGANSLLSSSGGHVRVTAAGGGTGTGRNNYGLNLQGGAVISAGGTGTVAINATGGKSTGFGNYGVFMVTSPATQITSGGGNIDITATAGPTTEGDSRGMQLQTGPGIIGVGPASITLRCTGSTGTGVNNHGLRLVAGPSITAVDGDITITTAAPTPGSLALTLSNSTLKGAKIQTTGTGQISIAADSIDLTADVSIDAGPRTVTLRPQTPGLPLNLGSTTVSTPGLLELSDAELDRVFAGNLILGSPTTGPITLSAPLSHTGGITLRSSAPITPTLPGTDLAATTLTLPPGQALGFTLNGPTPDTGYTQLKHLGSLTLDGAILTLTGTHIPTAGQNFLLINNDGTDPILGTFAGLPENAPFLFNGVLLRLTYQGGDGNDAVLRIFPYLAPVTLSDFSLTTDPAGHHLHLTLQGGLLLGYETFRLDYTDDLLRWHPLSTTQATPAGTATFDLLDPTTDERRFYRAVLP